MRKETRHYKEETTSIDRRMMDVKEGDAGRASDPSRDIRRTDPAKCNEVVRKVAKHTSRVRPCTAISIDISIEIQSSCYFHHHQRN